MSVHKAQSASNRTEAACAMANPHPNMLKWILPAGYVRPTIGFVHPALKIWAMAVSVRVLNAFGEALVKMANANAVSSPFLTIPSNMPVKMAKSSATRKMDATVVQPNANGANNATMVHAFYNAQCAMRNAQLSGYSHGYA